MTDRQKEEMTMIHRLQLENLTKRFGQQTILENINATFIEKQITGIIGRNGSGKSVLMKMIGGLCKPSAGRVCIDQMTVGVDMEFPHSMGLLIDTPGFLPFYSGLKNLCLLAEIRNIITEDTVKSVMINVGLDPLLKKKVSKYSMGMRQRLGIAQAIMESPDLLMLDEPFNGLDKKGVREMRSVCLSLRDEGKIILLSSHNQQDIDELCDAVYEIDEGQLIQLR